MKEDEGNSWFSRIKQFIQGEPQNKEELIQLLRDAQIRELIDAETLNMIESAMHFSQMRVRDIMLPKKQMICIHQDAPLVQVIETITRSGHSRFPVVDANGEEFIGILHAKDLMFLLTEPRENLNLSELVRTSFFVPESKRLDILLSEFKNTRNHMALVVDEYGLVSGFVTIEDIIEQIIGDIEDEFDIDEEAYIKTHGDAHYIVKAQTPIEEFNQQLNTRFSDDDYDTIGGIVMTEFGYLPGRGESIIIKDFEFKVINADARRIHLLACHDLRPSRQQFKG